MDEHAVAIDNGHARDVVVDHVSQTIVQTVRASQTEFAKSTKYRRQFVRQRHLNNTNCIEWSDRINQSINQSIINAETWLIAHRRQNKGRRADRIIASQLQSQAESLDEVNYDTFVVCYRSLLFRIFMKRKKNRDTEFLQFYPTNRPNKLCCRGFATRQ
jgi:hypothetical protein